VWPPHTVGGECEGATLVPLAWVEDSNLRSPEVPERLAKQPPASGVTLPTTSAQLGGGGFSRQLIEEGSRSVVSIVAYGWAVGLDYYGFRSIVARWLLGLIVCP
jgi:hypothetical protein